MNTNNKEVILRLKEKESNLLNSVKKAHKQKNEMKKRFTKYVKESGYVPPRFKYKR